MNLDFPETRARLEREIEDGLFTRGAQVAVVYRGERVLDLAMGDSGTGSPMRTDTVFRVYCTIKPITALAVAQLVDAGEVTLDDALETRLPQVRSLRDGVTLRHVLTHTAGLHLPLAVRMEFTPPARRREVVERMRRPPGWRVGNEAAYSEYAGWHILGWLVESVTGAPLRVHLRSAVLDPLQMLDTWIGMTHDEYTQVFPRLGVNQDMRHLKPFPMLFERLERMATEVNPAHGGYTTARDLATLYAAALDVLSGAPRDGLPTTAALTTFCSNARPAMYDQVLDRVCPYGLGFMTSLDTHAFGTEPGAASFGHSGNVGASFAFADPDHQLAVAVIFNGIVDSDSAFLRRPALVRALYADVSPIHEEAPTAEPGRRRFFGRGGRHA